MEAPEVPPRGRRSEAPEPGVGADAGDDRTSPGARELIYRYRGPLLSPPLLAALLLGGAGTGPGPWMGGLALFAAGAATRVWAGQHVRYRLGDAHRLATSGPYRRVRNPVYLGTVLLCAGAVLTTGRWWLVGLTVGWCAAVYAVVVRFEEAHLAAKFGDAYRAYRERVPRWLPRPASGPLGLATDHLPASLRAEAGTLLVLLPFLLRPAL